MDLEAIRRAAIGAAYQGGQVIRECLGRRIRIRKKGTIDLVTEADLGAEKAIISALRYRYPDHAVLAEEGGLTGGSSPHRWIIDPLDGTTNFAHGIPLFCISIAFESAGEILAGVVLNPVSGELFTAIRGGGATLNGVPVAVSDRAELVESLLVTGFPYEMTPGLDAALGRFGRCLAAAQGVRRLGAAALDLCYVACGRFDGFWEQGLKPWDTAAGTLIVQEAGGRVTAFDGGSYTPGQADMLATNGRIHEAMITLLAYKEGI